LAKLHATLIDDEIARDAKIARANLSPEERAVAHEVGNAVKF